jgi:hypothetical protein
MTQRKIHESAMALSQRYVFENTACPSETRQGVDELNTVWRMRNHVLISHVS